MKHYKNETGTALRLDCGINLGTAPVYHIKTKNPAGVVGTFTGTLFSSYSDLAGLDGTYYVSHTLAYTDLNIAGEWEFQAYIAGADGTWWGETVKLEVYDAFE
jgi:hypothetical protein